MSLVAYNSSDDSQSSDEDVEKPALNVQSDALTGQISDEDESPLISTSDIHIGNNEKQINGSTVTFQPHDNDASTLSLLKGLPPPVHYQHTTEKDEIEEAVQPKASQESDAHKPPSKLGISLNDEDEVKQCVQPEATQVSDSPKPPEKVCIPLTEDDELEEVVQPKPSQVSDAPKPPHKRTKQPAKISIPAVQYSSDEEGDEPATKKQKVSTGKSGLFSLLPEPVHAAKKETNRLLVPHTLTKKTQPKEDKIQAPVSQAKIEIKPVTDPAPVPQKYSTPFQALTGYYSDSDEEESSGNFFSLSSPTSKSAMSVPSSSHMLPSLSARSEVALDSSDSSKNNVPEVTSSTEPTVSSMEDKSKDELGDAEASVNLPSLDPDAPLDFKPSVNPDAPLSFKSSVNAHMAYGLAGPFRAKPGPAYYNQPDTAIQPKSTGVGYGSYQQELMDAAYSESNQEDIALYLEDEQFLRLQGKKQRGKEEINIVDANMDDFVNSSNIELTKGLTEESQQTSHKRNKDNNPTHTQKKKHQITYLAFQAKERELELKNTWSDNRLTKKQTQAKYGF